MTLLNKIVVLLIALGAVLGLSACDHPNVGDPKPAAQQPPEPSANKMSTNNDQRAPSSRGYSSDEVTMPDGLIVQCLRYYDGGATSSIINCDWNRAHR